MYSIVIILQICLCLVHAAGQQTHNKPSISLNEHLPTRNLEAREWQENAERTKLLPRVLKVPGRVTSASRSSSADVLAGGGWDSTLELPSYSAQGTSGTTRLLPDRSSRSERFARKSEGSQRPALDPSAATRVAKAYGLAQTRLPIFRAKERTREGTQSARGSLELSQEAPRQRSAPAKFPTWTKPSPFLSPEAQSGDKRGTKIFNAFKKCFGCR